MIGTTIETGQIGLFIRLDVPTGAIESERVAAMMIDLDQHFMPETRLFQTKRLTTGPGTDLYR